MNYEESRAYIRAAELKKGIVLGLDNMRVLNLLKILMLTVMFNITYNRKRSVKAYE